MKAIVQDSLGTQGLNQKPLSTLSVMNRRADHRAAAARPLITDTKAGWRGGARSDREQSQLIIEAKPRNRVKGVDKETFFN